MWITDNLPESWLKFINEKSYSTIVGGESGHHAIAAMKIYYPKHSADYFQIIFANNFGRVVISDPLPMEWKEKSIRLFLDDIIEQANNKLANKFEEATNSYMKEAFELRFDSVRSDDWSLCTSMLEMYLAKKKDLQFENVTFTMPQAGLGVVTFTKDNKIVDIATFEFARFIDSCGE